ncbi:MAG: Sun protein [Thermotoga sp. 47_83]|jgi:16S rRNA (cytosine967-C5)-methyltransferase|uniref:16S rRNA (cytosine(967)-C(5))-methyltransferase n=1 Tax=Thermotoga petrophila TaxID=93929 RepID=UPI00074776D8|nr:MAG: Sun protein [Thermotoga sp. 47_83]MBZ4661319.1 sun protein [Thermotoga sp.]HBT99535.1 16S rRNA (cytosine(967)-C(5))-methyltransferase [Thermotoga petrophila]
MKTNVRLLAYRLLRKYEKEKFILREDVDSVLSFLDDKDRRFFKELVWGVVRKEELLDWYINQLLKKKDIPPAVRVALRMGAYQLLFMNSVPDYAAVSETVKLVKSENFKKLVNAVLRRLRTVPEPKELHLIYSHPEWIVNYWRSFLPEEAVLRIMKWNQEPLPVMLRVNSLATTKEEVIKILAEEGTEAVPGKHAPFSLVVRKLGISMNDSRVIKDGLASVQGESSQLVPFFMELKPGLRVLDTCAAPGGKTTAIAELVKDQGKILAVDISREKTQLVEKHAKRLKLSSIETKIADVERLTEYVQDTFDRILVDAPCTSLGTARNHPEVLRRVNKEDFKKFSEIQLRMVQQAWQLLEKGGILLYSTCTVTKEENTEVVKRFVSERKDVEVIDTRDKMKEFEVEGIWDGYGFLMLPDETITPFYVSVLRKMG